MNSKYHVIYFLENRRVDIVYFEARGDVEELRIANLEIGEKMISPLYSLSGNF